jgi:hypothetical protein
MSARRPLGPILLSLAAAACSSSSPAPHAEPVQSSPAPVEQAAPVSRNVPALPQPDFLKYIPSDTPYLFAALSPLPPEYAAREYVSRLAAYERVRPAVEDLRKRRPREMRRLGFLIRLQVALLGEMGGSVSAEKLAAIGLDPSTVGVLYGLGMNPVVRVRLSDPARFASVLGRMARRLQPMERAALGSQRYYAARDDAVLWIIAVAGHDLVVALIPPAQRALWLPLILGQRAPQRSLAGDRRLDVLAAEHGLSPAGIGYADMKAIAASLGAALPAPCRDELVEMAGAMPRVAVGLTAATGEQMRARSAVEMRADVAGAIAGLRGEVPGSEAAAASSIEISAGLDMTALAGWLNGALGRITARPFRCPSLAWVNELARDQVATLRQAAASLGGVRGASFSVSEIEGLASGSADIFVLLGSDRPTDVLGRLTRALGVPAPQLSPGDPPVELASVLGGAFGKVHVALAPRALGLSLGADSGELAGRLAAGTIENPPLLTMRLDPQAVLPLLRLTTSGGDPRIASVDPDLARDLAEIDLLSLERFDDVRVTVRATPRGLDVEMDGKYAR